MRDFDEWAAKVIDDGQTGNIYQDVSDALREARAEGMRDMAKVKDILGMIVNTEHFFENSVRQWAREGLALLSGEVREP